MGIDILYESIKLEHLCRSLWHDEPPYYDSHCKAQENLLNYARLNVVQDSCRLSFFNYYGMSLDEARSQGRSETSLFRHCIGMP